MVRLKTLRQKIPAPPLTEQCSHKIKQLKHWHRAGGYWHDARKKRSDEHGWKRELCQKPATIILDGRYYCRSHAGQVLLEELEAENT